MTASYVKIDWSILGSKSIFSFFSTKVTHVLNTQIVMVLLVCFYTCILPLYGKEHDASYSAVYYTNLNPKSMANFDKRCCKVYLIIFCHVFNNISVMKTALKEPIVMQCSICVHVLVASFSISKYFLEPSHLWRQGINSWGYNKHKH